MLKMKKGLDRSIGDREMKTEKAALRTREKFDEIERRKKKKERRKE